MDWQRCMNQAMEYIEEHLTEKIDYAAVAQFMSCSEWEFRRMFSFLAQIPLSEYIRRRRLTVAASELQNGAKIIDTALQYGCESQAAFSRAFRQWHGVAPSSARDKETKLKSYPRLTFKLVLMEEIGLGENCGNQGQRTSIIGAGEVGYAISIEAGGEAIHEINERFWNETGGDVLGAITLPLLGAYVSEENCRLFGDVTGKRVLELGCGTGQSLWYLGERKASELWGIDLSGEQIEKARRYLTDCGLEANLIRAPMEEDCGLPMNYFDIVYSIYGIGWTTDLEGTFRRIFSYLKRGGEIIFSWSHPIHKCVASESGSLVFQKCYFDESWYAVSVGGGRLSLSDRKMSTYVNALAQAGFVIEQMVEQSDEDILRADKASEFAEKAKMLPVTFAIKARKP